MVPWILQEGFASRLSCLRRALELPRLPDMTFPGERSSSSRSAAPRSILPAQRARGAWPAQHRLPRSPLGCSRSPRSPSTLWKVPLVSFYFRVFWVRIILILFCLHNPDCYHPTNYSHIFLQTANGRDKTAAGLCDFCLSNYCNYLKNGLKLYGVMNFILSLQRCLVLRAACKWASFWAALHKAAAGGTAASSSRREAPAPPHRSKGRQGTLRRLAWQTVLISQLISSLCPILIKTQARQSAGSLLVVACCSRLALLDLLSCGACGDQLICPDLHTSSCSGDQPAGSCQRRQVRQCWQTCPTRAAACCSLLETLSVVFAVSPLHARNSKFFHRSWEVHGDVPDPCEIWSTLSAPRMSPDPQTQWISPCLHALFLTPLCSSGW